MTRINAAIPPRYLIDQHLVAEYVEILRVPNHVLKHGIKGAVPKKFTLGTGHVTFFFDKIAYLHKRFNALVSEMHRRDYYVGMDDSSFVKLQKSRYYNDCDISYANPIIIERIRERVLNMKREPTIKGVRIERQYYCALLNIC